MLRPTINRPAPGTGLADAAHNALSSVGAGSYTGETMTVTVELPEAARARLEAEAARRGITLAQLVAETAEQLAERLPVDDVEPAPGTLEGFFGSGDSGDPTWATRDLHELRHDLAQRRLAEPA